jgi:hypothetical protein
MPEALTSGNGDRSAQRGEQTGEFVALGLLVGELFARVFEHGRRGLAGEASLLRRASAAASIFTPVSDRYSRAPPTGHRRGHRAAWQGGR